MQRRGDTDVTTWDQRSESQPKPTNSSKTKREEDLVVSRREKYRRSETESGDLRKEKTHKGAKAAGVCRGREKVLRGKEQC